MGPVTGMMIRGSVSVSVDVVLPLVELLLVVVMGMLLLVDILLVVRLVVLVKIGKEADELADPDEIVKVTLLVAEAEAGPLLPVLVVLVTMVLGTHFPLTATTAVPVHSPFGKD